VAVAPDELSLAQLAQLIGQAWEGSAAPGVKQIRVLVGLVQPVAFSALVGDLDARMAALEQALGNAGSDAVENR